MSNTEQIGASGSAMLLASACASIQLSRATKAAAQRDGYVLRTRHQDCAMKLHETSIRVCFPIKPQASFPPALLILLALFWIGLPQRATAQRLGACVPVVNPPLSEEQIVNNLIGMNLERAQALVAFQVTETYRLAYRGFPGPRNAEMIVDAKYQSPRTKIFAIQSATGSPLILDRVFKKLLQAEGEALGTEAQRHTALNRDNYNFELVGCESMPSGSMYVLHVQPRRKGRFLYCGRIWVDAKDFAVARIEAEPAKNPSFWTKRSKIERVYGKVGDFWLPTRNHSISTVRLGGSAELTIEYTNYQIAAANAVGNLPTSKPVQTAETTRAQPTKLQATAQAPAE